jgi:2-polyprenyl-3-methyl-5-hydroxy-6-metoxy-1,4-benzoquinol methylase
MSIDERVAHHFDLDAERFDAIYQQDAKSPFARFIDDHWRGVVAKRLELALAELSPLEGKTILDVGCGSGRYCHAFAERGAPRVVGIDFAPAMIGIARRLAHEFGVGDRCEFHLGSFPDDAPEERFHASVAMGLFDYTEDPGSVLRAMRERTSAVMLMSFPKSREWRVPLRKLRFAINRCPLFLYGRRDVEGLLARVGITDARWVDLGRDYVIIARP